MTSATVFPDTTILVQYQALDRIDWNAVLGVDQVRLMISGPVWQEMEDIKNQDISPSLARRAAVALNELQAIIDQPLPQRGAIQIARLEDPEIDYMAEGLDPASMSDVLVASVIAYQQENALEYVVLVTDDVETRQKARAAGIEVGFLPHNYLKSEQSPANAMPPRSGTAAANQPLAAPTVQKLTQAGPLFQSKPLAGANAAQPQNKAPSSAPFPEVAQEKIHASAAPKQKTASGKPAGAQPGRQVHANAPEEFIPPFLEIKQEPARPLTGHVELFNVPKKPKEKAGETGASHNPLSLPPIALETNSIDRPSFTLKNQVRLAEPENPFEPLIPTEEPKEKTELRLAFSDDETRKSVIIHHPIYPTIDDIAEQLMVLRKQHPKLTQVMASNSGDGVGDAWTSPDMINALHQRRSHRIKRYNRALDAFYSRSEKYLTERNEYENFRRRSIQLNLCLLNDLPDSLKSLYIAVHFPGNLRVYSEDNLPDKPTNPTPPEMPDLDALFEKITLPTVVMPGEIMGSNKIQLRTRHIAPMEIRWNKGWDVIYSIREIEKNDALPFNPLFIVFNSFEHATSFRIHYRITVASASYEELGALEVLVRKEF